MNLSPTIIITVIALYFCMLIAVSYFTSRKATNDSFFLGERKSPWYLVSFGMIGASLSGVTFLSIPGWVGNAANQFSYMQAVLGYFFGYLVIAYVLIPLYYKMNLTSIYEYLKSRFGFWSYKTGAGFFLLSRIVGSSVRLMLVAVVLHDMVFKELKISFEVTVIIAVALIWVYTNRGGIKTIVWTDTLQTAFMLLSVVLTVLFLADQLDVVQSKGIVSAVSESSYSKVFFFDDFMTKNHFFKHFLGGMFITIGMTGLDQDMMQKNLSCRSIKDAQKNVISMAAVLVLVNLIFLGLGALLYMYADQHAIDFENPDLLFSKIALSDSAGPMIGILFVLGLVAAAYSSADSALTALTTSFSVDFLGINEGKIAEEKKMRVRKVVHIGMSAVTILTVIFLYYAIDQSGSAIGILMTLAGFTYGPLIGMFFFGILTKRAIKDGFIPFVCGISILVTILMWYYSKGAPGIAEGSPGIFGDYQFGFELILVNAMITFGLLFAVSRKSPRPEFAATSESLID